MLCVKAPIGYSRDHTIAFFVFYQNNLLFVIGKNRPCRLQQGFKIAAAGYSRDSK